MIRCLLFGHAPHPMFEYGRFPMGRRHTYCERCGVGVIHIVSEDFPLPEGARPASDWDDERMRRAALIVSERVSDEIETLVRLRKAEIKRLLANHTAKGTAKKPPRRVTNSRGGT